MRNLIGRCEKSEWKMWEIWMEDKRNVIGKCKKSDWKMWEIQITALMPLKVLQAASSGVSLFGKNDRIQWYNMVGYNVTNMIKIVVNTMIQIWYDTIWTNCSTTAQRVVGGGLRLCTCPTCSTCYYHHLPGFPTTTKSSSSLPSSLLSSSLSSSSSSSLVHCCLSVIWVLRWS